MFKSCIDQNEPFATIRGIAMGAFENIGIDVPCEYMNVLATGTLLVPALVAISSILATFACKRF